MDVANESILEEAITRTMELEDELELVEVEATGKGKHPLVRLYLYKPTGVTIEDCERVNRRLSRELEEHEELDTDYAIEVSSLGLDRKLRSRRDFERAVGEVLRLQVRDDEDGKVREKKGLLTEVEEETLLMEPPVEKTKSGRKKKTGEPFRVPLASIEVGTIEVMM